MVEELRRVLMAGAVGSWLAALSVLVFHPSTVAGESPKSVMGTASDPLTGVAQTFRRPSALPYDKERPNSARVRLGQALFGDTRLSGTGTHACASCHDPLLAFTDGVAIATGATGKRLDRHTPTLWNLAWSESFFWDGRATTLEAQAKAPIEHPSEMAGNLAVATGLLGKDPAVMEQAKEAFPGEHVLLPEQILRALAAYERTIVSPVTRFDHWVAGDKSALTEDERAGFALFVGKAGCIACHSGWAFTDRAFHDVGLPSEDRGRFNVLGLDAVDHAFRTPGLRELAWTAPYMHDGSLPTLDAVLDHYTTGVVTRPSLSTDLPKIQLTASDRGQLLAFLATLSSETPPEPLSLGTSSVVAQTQAQVSARVSQKDKQFHPSAVQIAKGHPLSIINDDKRTHNVRWDGEGGFNSGAQEPGQAAILTFPSTGTYHVYCGIHPVMRLVVQVSAE